MNTNYLLMNKTCGSSNLHYYHSSSELLGSRGSIILWVILWVFSRLNSSRSGGVILLIN